jgi:general secretion pathway protein L
MPSLSFDLPKDDTAPTPDRLEEFITALPGPLQGLRVELAAHEYLFREFTLPRAARAHLTETVGYQLSKLTPFSADQMLYACGARADASNDGTLKVWLAGVPKHRLARPLALIGHPPPANPLPVDAPPAADQPLAFSWSIAAPATRSPRRMRLAWIGVLAIWIGAVGVHLHKRSDTREQIETRVAALRAEAAAVATLRTQLDDLGEQSAWLTRRKQSGVASLVVLDALAQMLDDRSWLHRFEFDGKEISLMVASASPSELIETLESSQLFTDVRFDSLTRDNRNDTDRFNIRARVHSFAEGDG